MLLTAVVSLHVSCREHSLSNGTEVVSAATTTVDTVDSGEFHTPESMPSPFGLTSQQVHPGSSSELIMSSLVDKLPNGTSNCADGSNSAHGDEHAQAIAAVNQAFGRVASFDQWNTGSKHDSDRQGSLLNSETPQPSDPQGRESSQDLDTFPNVLLPWSAPSVRPAAAEKEGDAAAAVETEGGTGSLSNAAPFEGADPIHSTSTTLSVDRTSAQPSKPPQPAFWGADDSAMPRVDSSEPAYWPPVLTARMSITPAPPSPFHEPDAAAARQSSTHVEIEDKGQLPHKQVEAADEAPLMTAMLSPNPLPMSPSGDG